MEIKLERGNHGLQNLLQVGQNTVLELVDVAAQHVARGGFFFQSRRANGNSLVADFDLFVIVVFLFLLLAPVFIVLVRDDDVRLQIGRLQQRLHHDFKIRDEFLAKALAQTRPGLKHVLHRWVVVFESARLETHQHIHDFTRILSEAGASNGHTDERNALHSLGAQHAVLLSVGVHQDGLQVRKDGVVVLDEGFLRVVRGRCERRERRFLHRLVARLQ
mmetsp:Transcript_7663/g.30737  ORF Transcript_7663/g.30737 Transcript_7663/m.30737 type:complete len:218 (+) Transcript_7663:1227-1880(+)